MVQRIVVPTHCLLLGDQNRINGNSTGKTSKASWLQKAFPSVGVADLCSHHWIGSVHGTDYHMIPLGLCSGSAWLDLRCALNIDHIPDDAHYEITMCI